MNVLNNLLRGASSWLTGMAHNHSIAGSNPAPAFKDKLC